jgi:cyclic pyranopterin phosphate synthase
VTELTHTDDGGHAHLVDVGAKAVSARRAVAEGVLVLPAAIRDLVFAGDLPKGDAVAVARIAAIQATKETPRLIPLCHAISPDGVSVQITPCAIGIRLQAEVTVTAKTGVEMEALTAVSVGLLALYDMVKSVCRSGQIDGIRLLHKSGGRSGTWDAG